ncbi:phosphoenolpyruvate-protein phosphotransferase [Acetobacter sp. CAG:977]|nr:phosphoenolpyruvate-protein phosphotransferase [Acetobacter sp. CAG:977]
MTNFTKIKRVCRAGDEIPQDVAGTVVVRGKETTCQGKGVSPGIVIGRAYVYDNLLTAVPQYRITADAVEGECKRFLTAVRETSGQFELLWEQAKGVLEDDPVSYLFDVYRHMLNGSRLLSGVQNRIKNDLINAEAAVQVEIGLIADAFAAMDDAYIASRLEDIRGVGRRLIRNLMGGAQENFSQLPENAVILARDLSAADTALLDPKKVAAFATMTGSPQSHTGLLARSLGIPAVVAAPNLLTSARTGDVVIIDGAYGKIIICPSQEEVDRYRKYRADFLRWKRSLKRLRSLPSVTQDGVSVSLKGNIDLPTELEILVQAGVDGIGLLRSEYMFMNRNDLPSEDEQFEILKGVTARMEGKPVTFRTFDVGGDKCPTLLNTSSSQNPALGVRGIRYALRFPELLATQFAAVLRVAAYADVRVLLPMVCSVEEVVSAREIFNRVADRLRAAGTPIGERVPLGVMIEIPGAALNASVLARHCDFMSIGTNDLIQYALAVDRTDAAVSSLFNPLHPAVLKLIKMTADAAKEANIPLCVCGEMAANARYAALLLGLGVRELSMPATNVAMVKERIRSMKMSDMASYANSLLSLSSSTEVINAVNAFESQNR